MVKTYAYGFPRIGKNRVYKKMIETFIKNSSLNSENINIINKPNNINDRCLTKK